jgi:hypothetical protein
VNPTSYAEWVSVARERASDANALVREAPRPVAAVYMAGYAIECSLKAYLNRYGRPFSTHGREGHDLRGLWEQADFRLSDLGDSAGETTFFIERWSTNLRYEVHLEGGLDAGELVRAAATLSGNVQSKLRWGSPTRRL